MTESSTKDPLTGVYTRKFFEEMVRVEIGKFKRYGARFSLLMLDLDRFKEVNDTLGHKMGDKVLINIVNRLKELLRDSDIVARWGGDEFVVLLPYTDEKSAMRVAKRIVDNLKIKVQDIPVGVSCSFVTPKFGEDVSYEKMFEHLDELLYRAKRQGRGKVGNTLDLKDRLVIPSYKFVSRNSEYRELMGAVKSEYSGLVIVSGETGIGKSRLVKEFFKREQLPYVVTRSFGPVKGIPLFSIKNLFMSFYRDHRDIWNEFVNCLNEEDRNVVSAFIPSLSKGHRMEEGFQTYFLARVAEILMKFFSKLEIPVLWIDDLQWIGEETLTILAHILKDSELKVVTTLRTEERERIDAFLEKNAIRFKEVRINRLDLSGTRELLKAILGEQPDDRTVHSVWEYAGGIPFYIEEILVFLAEKGYLKEQDSKILIERPPESVPSSLEDIVSYKLRAFDEKELYVLWFLAVYHNPLGMEKIESLIGISYEIVKNTVIKGVTLGIVLKEKNKVFFSSEIVRRIIVSKIPRGRFIKFNRLAAEEKERVWKKQEVEPFEIYDHYVHTKLRDKIAYWALLCGRESQNRFSPYSAFVYFREAFFNFENRDKKKEALLGMIRNGRTAGRVNDTLRIIEQYGKDYLEEHIYKYYLGSVYILSGRVDESFCLLKDAEAKAPNIEFKAECMFEMALLYRRQGRLNDCLKELETLLNLDVSFRFLMGVRAFYGGVLVEKGDIARAEEVLKKVIAEGEKSHMEYRITSAYINYALLKASFLQYAEAERYYKKAIEICEKGEERGKLLTALNNLGTLYLSTGRLQDAERCYMRGLDIARETGNHSLEVIILNNLGSSARERGLYKQAYNFYMSTVKKAKEYGYPEWVTHSTANILITFANYDEELAVDRGLVREFEKMLISLDVPNERAYGYVSLMDYYRKKRNFNRAGEYISKFKKLPHSIREQYILNFYVSLARYYDAMENKRMSDYYIKKISEIADKTDDMPTKAELYKDIADWFFEHGRYRKARAFYKKAVDLDRWLSKGAVLNIKKKIEELNEST